MSTGWFHLEGAPSTEEFASLTDPDQILHDEMAHTQDLQRRELECGAFQTIWMLLLELLLEGQQQTKSWGSEKQLYTRFKLQSPPTVLVGGNTISSYRLRCNKFPSKEELPVIGLDHLLQHHKLLVCYRPVADPQLSQFVTLE